MEENSLVSIIIPVYNTEAYLERCIDSILEQTYKNIEIVLVEDGSSDGSFEKCLALSEKHANILLIKHQINMGLEATRNDGINAAKGKWLLFLDSDDTLENNTVEELVKVAVDFNSDVVFFNFTYVKNDCKTPVQALIAQGHYTKEDFVKNILIKMPLSFVSCVGSKFYNVDFLRKNKLLFNRKYKFNEDAGFILEALEKAESVYYLNSSFYNYILRESGSIQTSYRQNMYSTIRNVHLLLRDIIDKYNCGKRAKKQFNLLCAQFIRVCLKNEKQFKGYKSFVEMRSTLKNDDIYGRVSKHPLSTGSFKYCLFLFLFRVGFKKLLYWAV